MTLDILRLLFDFGLVVLIWMVQLIIYPSFLFYEKNNLISWHKIYVQRISYIVIPLMFGQLIVSTIQAYQYTSIYTLGSLFLVILVWGSTFSQFVPLHNKISKEQFTLETLQKLVKRNWIRTVLWTLIFVYGIISFIYPIE